MRAGLRMWNPRWISPAVGVRRYPPRSPPSKCLFYCAISAVFGWLPEGVASQKSGPVASDVPRYARQHTFSARKEPENNGLSEWTPTGPFAGPRKPAARRLPARSSPEYTAMNSNPGPIRLSFRCLARSCLGGHERLDISPLRGPQRPCDATRSAIDKGSMAPSPTLVKGASA